MKNRLILGKRTPQPSPFSDSLGLAFSLELLSKMLFSSILSCVQTNVYGKQMLLDPRRTNSEELRKKCIFLQAGFFELGRGMLDCRNFRVKNWPSISSSEARAQKKWHENPAPQTKPYRDDKSLSLESERLIYYVARAAFSLQDNVLMNWAVCLSGLIWMRAFE